MDPVIDDIPIDDVPRDEMMMIMMMMVYMKHHKVDLPLMALVPAVGE